MACRRSAQPGERVVPRGRLPLDRGAFPFRSGALTLRRCCHCERQHQSDRSGPGQDAQPRFRTHVLGPHFENLAREFTFRFASPATVGGQVASVGPAVVNDTARRTQHEVDVVALAREQDGSSRVLGIGEAKHTTSKRTLSDLARLDDLRELIAKKQPSAIDSKLLLFSASGFERNLKSSADDRADVELVDVDRLYTGD